jgi:riboflavin transporter FmnP
MVARREHSLPDGRGCNVKLSGVLKVAVLAALSAALMRLQIPTFVPYLKYDPSDCPALVASFALGPVYGALVILLKNLIFGLTNFQPMELVGLPLNTLAGLVFVLVSGHVYRLRKTKKMAVTALALGVLAMVIVMVPANILLYPLFSKLFLNSTVQMTSEMIVNMVILACIPFNLLKGTLTSVLTFLVYKRFSAILKNDPQMDSSIAKMP